MNLHTVLPTGNCLIDFMMSQIPMTPQGLFGLNCLWKDILNLDHLQQVRQVMDCRFPWMFQILELEPRFLKKLKMIINSPETLMILLIT